MKIYEIRPCSHIVVVAEEMVAIANKIGEPVVAEFNGTGIVANPGNNPDDIVYYYFKQRQILQEFLRAKNQK